MDRTFVPQSEAELVDAVRWAMTDGHALAVSGAGTKLGWGRPVGARASLSLRDLAGIDLYEPEELVLSAGAGTPLAEIERRLAQHGQQLAFEPPDLGPLFGAAPATGSLGGAIGCNLAGPRRISAGAARDHVLGFNGVNGLAERFKAGGRVVKNVTGFDLSKLIAGSFGTLAVMTRITLKVLPAPEDCRTVVAVGLDAARAVAVLGEGLRSPHDVSGAAYLPARIAAKSRVGVVAGAGASVAALRLEGAAPSVVARAEALRRGLAPYGDIAELSTAESQQLWREIRDVAPYLDDADQAIWHLSVPPASGAKVAADIGETLDAEYYFDWGGGRIWLATAMDATLAEDPIRRAVSVVGGHATLVRGGESSRREAAVFQPPVGAEAALIRRLKENFDPHGIFNPGRMYDGL